MHLLFAALLLGHWLLASDLHVVPGRGAPAPAAFAADTNWALLSSTIAAMREADPNPQVVILSGDFLAHNFPDNVPLAVRTMTRIAHVFDAAFPRTQFVIVPGNNDDPCGDYRASPGDAYFKALAHIWAPLVNRNGAAPDFELSFARNGWYTARLPQVKARLIALNSVYWSVIYRRCAGGTPGAPQQQLRWFANTLRNLPAQTRAVVVMHIPPGVDAGNTAALGGLIVVPYWTARASAAFVQVLSANQDRIGFAIAGHAHRNAFRLFGGVPILVAPSISPIYKNNPSFLRLDLAPDGTLHDYQPFFYDEYSGTWQTADTFDQTYGVRSFSAASLAAIHAQLATDRALRAKWAHMYMAQSDPRDITAVTWAFYWCAQTEFGAGYVACAHLQRRQIVLPVALGGAVAALIALVAFFAVRRARQRAPR